HLGTVAPYRLPGASIGRGETSGAIGMAGNEASLEGLAAGEANPAFAFHRAAAPRPDINQTVPRLEPPFAVRPAVPHVADVVAVDGGRVVGRRAALAPDQPSLAVDRAVAAVRAVPGEFEV